MITIVAVLAATHAIGAVVRAALPGVILCAAERDLAGGEERVRRTGLQHAAVSVAILLLLTAATWARG